MHGLTLSLAGALEQPLSSYANRLTPCLRGFKRTMLVQQ
jgi:hypothetical protein